MFRCRRNQHARSLFEVSESYWPYERIGTEHLKRSVEGVDSYVARIRDLYLTCGCGSGSFSAADERTAMELFKRGIPVAVVEDAMLLGCARKYVSSENKAGSAGNRAGGWAPIGSLAYFEPLIEEVRLTPFSSEYRRYVRAKAKAYWQCCSRRPTLAAVRDSAGAKK